MAVGKGPEAGGGVLPISHVPPKRAGERTLNPQESKETNTD